MRKLWYKGIDYHHAYYFFVVGKFITGTCTLRLVDSCCTWGFLLFTLLGTVLRVNVNSNRMFAVELVPCEHSSRKDEVHPHYHFLWMLLSFTTMIISTRKNGKCQVGMGRQATRFVTRNDADVVDTYIMHLAFRTILIQPLRIIVHLHYVYV